MHTFYFDGSAPKGVVCVNTNLGQYVESIPDVLRMVGLDDFDVTRASSQRAEYIGLLFALLKIEDYNNYFILGDCENVILQMKGINKVKDPHLATLYYHAHKLINTRGLNVSFGHVPRDRNPAGHVLDRAEVKE